MRNLRLPRRGTVFSTRVIAFMAACVALATTAATAPDRTAATRTPRGVAPVRLTPYRGGLPQPSPARPTLLKASGYRHDGAQRPPPQPCPRARDGDRVVDWSTFTPSDSLPSRAAVYTDNTLVSYEFAHLFLSVVASLQALGHSVDVLVDPRKPHRSRIQLVDMAADHALDVDGARLAVVSAPRVGARLHVRADYGVFVAFGDMRAPDVRGVGAINAYYCTFPYRPGDGLPPGQLFTLPTYDLVLAPSQFALHQYLLHTELYLAPLVHDRAHVPQTFMLAPPVHAASRSNETIAKRDIVVPGHFAYNFEDVHRTALLLFLGLQGRMPADTRLILMGDVGHPEYLEKVKRMVGGLNVDVVAAESATRQQYLLAQARVVWMLMPAVEELLGEHPLDLGVEWRLYPHMGSTLASAMAAGTVPMVVDWSSVHGNMLNEKNGFMFADANQVLDATARLFGPDTTTYGNMATAAKRDVADRSHVRFTTALQGVLQHAVAARPFRHAVLQTPLEYRPIPSSAGSRKVAVTVEMGHHYALRWSAAQVMSRLPGWAVHVHHGLLNARFVKLAFVRDPGVRLTELGYQHLTAAAYDDLLKAPSFWEGVAADTVLLFHAGSVLTHNIDAFVDAGYDYVAAAAPERLDLGLPAADAGLRGASLRNVSAVMRACASHANTAASEDAVLRAAPGVRVAPQGVACTFGGGIGCPDVAAGEPAVVTATAGGLSEARLRAMLTQAVRGWARI